MTRARERDVSGPAWAPPGAPWCAESRRCKPGPGWPGRRGPAPGGHTADRRPGSPVAPALRPSARETFRFPVGCRRSRPRAQCRQCSPASCWLATLHRHGDAPREAPPRRPHGRRVPAARPGSAASWAVILCALGSLRGDGLGPRLVHVTHVPSHHGSADSGDRAGSRSQALASGHAPSGRPVLVVAVSVCGPPGSWGQSGRPGRAAQASAPEFAERQAWTEFAATLEEAQAGGEGCPSCLRRSVPGLELGAWPATRRPLAAPPGGQQVSRGTERWLLSGPRAPPVPGAGLRRLPGRRLRGARSRHRLVSTRRRDTACLPGTVAGTGVLGCALLWRLWGTVAPGAWRGSREEVAHLRSLPLWGPAKGYVANGEGVRFAC